MRADGGLVVLQNRGRHQFGRLAGPQVAHALEALSTIAPTAPSKTLRASDRARALRHARTCYDHLAGALGVALTDALCAAGILTVDELELTDRGAASLQAFGIDVAQLQGASVDSTASTAGRDPGLWIRTIDGGNHFRASTARSGSKRRR